MSVVTQAFSPSYSGPDLAELEALGRPPATERTGMLIWLRDWAEAHVVALKARNGIEARERLLKLAARCDDWPLISWLASERFNREESDIHEKVLLLTALWHLGRDEEALDFCSYLHESYPDNKTVKGLHQDLLATNKNGHGFGPVFTPWDSLLANDGELSLIPLARHHCDDFLWQYTNTEALANTVPPSSTTKDGWHRWLSHIQSQEEQIHFGIWHRDWGFIGSQSLLFEQGKGFFEQWLGTDFQGLDFAPRSASMLFNLAETTWRMHTCYANPREDHKASSHTLAELGFEVQTLYISSQHPNEYTSEQCLRRRSSGYVPAYKQADEAHFLFKAMGHLQRTYTPSETPLPPAQSKTQASTTGLPPEDTAA